jgi:hypothetical protein
VLCGWASRGLRSECDEEQIEGGGHGRRRRSSGEVAMMLRCDAPTSWAQRGGVGNRVRWRGEKEKGNEIFPTTLDAHRG